MRYDVTLKSLLHTLPQLFLRLLTGMEGQELLTVELPSVKSRHPDLLVRMADNSLFHLEIQSGPEPDMLCRMLEYQALLRCQYPAARLRQQVLYVGDPRTGFANSLEDFGISFRYTVVDIRELDGAPMLASPSLEENLLAILCHVQDGRQTIRQVLARIAPLPDKARADALQKLAILSGLRHLQPALAQEVREMPITVDVMENDFLRDIFERGAASALQQGLAQGEAKLLLRMLQGRYGVLSVDLANRVRQATPEQLERWSDRFLVARSLDEVFEDS